MRRQSLRLAAWLLSPGGEPMDFPTSGMIEWPADTLPSGGWLWCDGSAVSRATYADLFAVIGTIHGAGDGATTFNLPDRRGTFALGKDDMGGTAANRVTDPAADALGGGGGVETHTLTVAQMPGHAHPNVWVYTSGTYGLQYMGALPQNSGNTGQVGGGQAHNNLPPFRTVNVIIKT
ncbi:MAG: tail fiber protein [Anaerolineae bacterium]|nr:tail fiber protein [Anaerolineae bacterium]